MKTWREVRIEGVVRQWLLTSLRGSRVGGTPEEACVQYGNPRRSILGQ